MVFEKIPEGIRRGQSVPVRLQLGKPAEATLLTTGGFFSDTGGNWVYVLSEGGAKATKRNISLGRKNPQFFEAKLYTKSIVCPAVETQPGLKYCIFCQAEACKAGHCRGYCTQQW